MNSTISASNAAEDRSSPKGSIRFLAIVLCMVAVDSALLRSEDWPNYRGPTHDGISAEKNWLDRWPPNGPPVLWKSQVGVGFSSCTVANKRLFTLGNRDSKETLYCLNAENGSIVWRYDYDCDLDDRFFEGGPTSTPSVDSTDVYSLNREGDLNCIQVSDGIMRWSVNVARVTGSRVPGWGFAGSPLILGDRLIINVGESGAAFDKTSGALIWKSGDAEAGYMTPIPVDVAGKQCVLIASGKFYHCVDCENGRVFWKHRWLTTYGCNAASPLLKNGFAFISSGYGRGCSLLELGLENYRTVWSNKEMQNQLNSSVMVNGMVFGFDGDEGGDVMLKCVEFDTGKLKWSFAGLGSGALTASDGKLIVLSQTGELLVAPAIPTEFKPISRAQVLNGKCWTVPVLSDAKIYCRDATGELVCLDVHNP